MESATAFLPFQSKTDGRAFGWTGAAQKLLLMALQAELRFRAGAKPKNQVETAMSGQRSGCNNNGWSAHICHIYVNQPIALMTGCSS